jgi:hypothetical protein
MNSIISDQLSHTQHVNLRIVRPVNPSEAALDLEGLVFKAHRVLCVSTLGSKETKKIWGYCPVCDDSATHDHVHGSGLVD